MVLTKAITVDSAKTQSPWELIFLEECEHGIFLDLVR